jgi:succinate dehydrogenase / fumarate reductase membrane anchor subunit
MMRRTQLGRVRGLGSAKSGTGHWWAQRLTAVALIPLVIWFVVSVITLTGAPQPAVAAWLGNPLTATLMVLLIFATFHHAQLGLQVVIEDYVHGKGTRLALIVLVKFAAILLGTGSVIAVLKLCFAR